ncbi:MAG: hypothetical protein Q9188_007201 [Gyalolechia gomerana]
MPFEMARTPRRVIVTREVNTILGMGGLRSDLIQFRLLWHVQDSTGITEKDSVWEPDHEGRENPRLARTVDEAPTILPSRRMTRVHTPGEHSLPVRYIKGRQLGSGQFGTVYKAVDVDSATTMAVKTIQRPQCGWKIDSWNRMKREVETLARISHPHIIEYFGAQGWAGAQVELFMGLKEGSLETLIQDNMFQENHSHIANALFPQMLQALDCLAHGNILHRDIKPDNILYTSLPNSKYHFQLTDFGLCNLATEAITYAGSPRFMAPEILDCRGSRQTSKVDTWSLFVTVAYTLNAKGYRDRQINSRDEAIKAALAAASDPEMTRIKEMAIVDPEKRASAAQMLVKNYDGVGLSTPRENIPDLPVFGRCAIQPRRARRAGVQNPREPLAQLKARGVYKPLVPLNAQNRVQKRHSCFQTTLKFPLDR